MPARSPAWFCLLSATGLLLATTARGQEPEAGRPVSLKRTVAPSFRIEPVVHRFKARRGEVLPFSFEIGSLGRAMSVEVQPVRLRQEETGVILHDPRGNAPDGLKILTPLAFDLSPGERTLIRGELTTPLAKTNYLSYGLLVREAGQAPDYEDAGRKSTKAGVRFVTQYVLRVDVETGVAGVGDIKQLRLEQAGLVASGGLPVARAYLANPTDYAFECYVSASLKPAGSNRSIKARLVMPSRSGLDGPERNLVRVMPHSRLRLESPVNKTLSPGPQVMTLDVSSSRRRLFSSDFELNIRETDFPALASRRAVFAEGVVVSPAQLELGITSQTKRIATLEVKNTTDSPYEVSLDPRTLNDAPIKGVHFAPASFTLKPGRTKRVRAMLRSRESTAAASGFTRVSVASSDGDPQTHRMPLSVLAAEPAAPDFSISPIEWKQTPAGWGFVVTVSNRSDAYTPLSAQLAVNGKHHTRLLLHAGYGTWLAPRASTDLAFIPERPLHAGEHALELKITSREGFEPVVRRLNVSLTRASE